MRKYTPILIVVIIAAVLRLYVLGSNPPHLTPDEASLGYNAYSILKTGRDEYGELLPIVFKSFGDYKPGLYVYASIPFIGTLGLNEFSVRLPSALAGVLSVFLLYLIVKILFAKSEYVDKPEHFAVISAFLLAISPWHIHFSRGAWEANVALTLTLLGIFLFLKGIKNYRYFVWSAFFFALTLLTYQGAKLSTAIVLVILGTMNIKQLKILPRKTLFTAIFIGVLVASPVVLSIFQGKGGRLTVFSVFSYPREEGYVNAFLSESGIRPKSLGYYLFYSETQNFTRGILGRWFNHFSGRFLFFEGDWQNLRHTAPNHGVLLLADLPILLLGLAMLIRAKGDKSMRFVALWLLLAPLPAVLSRDQVHAVRSLHMVIPLTIISAYAIYTLLFYQKYKYVMRTFLALLYGGSIAYFLDAYFVHLPAHNSKLWEYGYKQVVQETLPLVRSHKKILVQQSYAQPYIFFLFYGASILPELSPQEYQKVAQLRESATGDVGQVEEIGTIKFVTMDWSLIRGENGSIAVGDTLHVPVIDSLEGPEFHVVKEIDYLDKKNRAFRIIEIKNK